MRGRLRVVDGDTVTWREVPTKYWQEKLEDGTNAPIIEAPTLPVGSEARNYREESNRFTLKVHHDGDFDEKLENHIGGLISYFDNCSLNKLDLLDVESMLSELGLLKGSYDILFCIPGADINRGLCQIESIDKVLTMTDLIVYSHCFDMYTTRRLVPTTQKSCRLDQGMSQIAYPRLQKSMLFALQTTSCIYKDKP